MIRTLIEVTGETEWEHKQQLEATLDKLGYQPKDTADHIRFMGDLWQEMQERGLRPQELAEAQRKKREARAV